MIVRRISCIAAAVAMIVAGVGSLARMVSAHTVPAQRSIVVQAEPHAVSILVTWTSSNTGGAEELLARAVVGRRGESARRSVRALATARALAPLKLLVDSKPLSVDRISTKVILDRDNTGRLGAAVLLSAEIPAGRHTLVVKALPGKGRTRLKWTDRSRGALVAARPREPGVWTTLSSLSLTWK